MSIMIDNKEVVMRGGVWVCNGGNVLSCAVVCMAGGCLAVMHLAG